MSDLPAAGDEARLTSDALQPGDRVTEQLVTRLARLEKYEHKLAEVARVYRNLNAARKSVEQVLKRLTPVQSIADVDELEQFLANLTVKSQHAGEQIGALTELDKSNRARIHELETRVAELSAADEERAALQRLLDTAAKERRVVEGQLDRTQQKLRLDIAALERRVAELDAENGTLRAEAKESQEPQELDAAALAARLSEKLRAGDGVDGMQALQALLWQTCGAPEGLVAQAELDRAVAAQKAAQDAAQAESQERVAELQQQLDQAASELAARAQGEDAAQARAAQLQAEVESLQKQQSPDTASSGDGLTAARVAEIVAAAAAGKVTAAAEKPRAAAPGKKKGGKNKRRNTTSAKPGSPLAPSPVQVPAEPSVAVTKAEIDRLISLVGGAKSSDMSADELQAQLAEAQEQAREHAARVQSLEADLGALEAELSRAQARLESEVAELQDQGDRQRQALEQQLAELK
ncbi:hypothetical protein LPJ70_005644, partial [Coemansia sp. RSA 2708]